MRQTPHKINREISIHAPREGGDNGQNHAKKKQREISIHAPREGGDLAC